MPTDRMLRNCVCVRVCCNGQQRHAKARETTTPCMFMQAHLAQPNTDLSLENYNIYGDSDSINLIANNGRLEPNGTYPG